MVQELVAEGFNVVCEDATSDVYLGEKFDIVHIGDVIEHVSDPQRLLAFAARHCSQGGRIIVRTPNPLNFDYSNKSRLNRISVENMEHISYIVPFHALELARRAKIALVEYWAQKPGGFTAVGLKRSLSNLLSLKIRHAYNELFGESNTYTTIFVYVFAKVDQ